MGLRRFHFQDHYKSGLFGKVLRACPMLQFIDLVFANLSIWTSHKFCHLVMSWVFWASRPEQISLILFWVTFHSIYLDMNKSLTEDDTRSSSYSPIIYSMMDSLPRFWKCLCIYTDRHSERNKVNSKVKYKNYTCNKRHPQIHKNACPVHRGLSVILF